MISGKGYVIAIDGPSASGKSSVSRELARKLGWSWVSTGAFYRGLALVAHLEGLNPKDEEALAELAHSKLWTVKMTAESTLVLHGGSDITERAMSHENGERASQISQLPKVRQALLKAQRDCALGVQGLVAEGRDCGTVVFPQAILKVYLTASQERRAQRRAKEQGLSLSRTETEQNERDKRDATRSAAPLQVAADARVLDSEDLGLNEVVEKIWQWAQSALAQSVKSF